MKRVRRRVISLHRLPPHDILCRSIASTPLAPVSPSLKRSLAMQTRLCIFTVALSLCAAILVAQTNRGGINGTVSDPSGAVVPNATVTITNVGTNETRKTQTSTIGTFSVQDLEPVVYRIQVEANGFKKELVENVKVDTA